MLEEKIKQDYITAMKAKDKQRSSTLSFLRAKIKDVMISNRVEKVEDGEVNYGMGGGQIPEDNFGRELAKSIMSMTY